MPNGFHGSREAWDRIEAPLRALDPTFEAFARKLGVPLGRNTRSWPERSVRWGSQLSRLIQLYLEDEDRLTWTLWVCASEDRSSARYWRREFLRKGVPIEDVAPQLASLLERAHELVTGWSSRDLELATELGEPPAS